jgi:hypothetical protein
VPPSNHWDAQPWLEFLQPLILNEWDEDNNAIYLLNYADCKEFVWAFKERWATGRFESEPGAPMRIHLTEIPGAFEASVVMVSACLREHEQHLREELNCRYILATPPHSAELNARPTRVDRLCERVTAEISYLKYLPNALVRNASTQAAHFAEGGERPTFSQQYNTIQYAGPQLPADAALLLVDDVRTTGRTTKACMARITERTGADQESIVRLFLAVSR